MTQAKLPNLNDVFQNYLKKYNHTSLNKIAIAVSGGPDSMALAHIGAQHFDGEIYILSVDHQLRDEAKKEASDVGEWVTGLSKANITHHILKWDHDDPDAAVMEKARMARYELMQAFCEERNIPLLLTGHHQDDQAETFLIRLIKGSGLDGLAAMEEERSLSQQVALGRPFLPISKNAIVEYCDDQNIPYVTDPSNENEDYLRPRLRAFIAGMAKEGMDGHLLSRTAERLGRAKAALNFYQNQAYDECVESQNNDLILDYSLWKALPDEIALRVLLRGIENFRKDGGYPVRMNKLEDLAFTLKNMPDTYSDRTLGGAIIRLKDHLKDSETKIVIEKE